MMKKRIIAIALIVACLLQGCSLPNIIKQPKSSGWIPEREAIITLWKPNYARGTVYNAATSNLTDVLSYSDEQIHKYVEMLKFCGFTGIQVTDMCSAWSGVSGYEFATQQIRKFADAAHDLDMKFTLWVWGAEFSAFGWADNKAQYKALDGSLASKDPDVIATFEKYYDIYASLADCSDRVIMHFYDPGNLTDTDDIVFFAKMFKDKVLAVNPKIDFGISCWNANIDKADTVAALGNDITFYESAHPSGDEEAKLFRGRTVELGTRLGTWSWGTIERETDQLAQWNFNAEFIKNTYMNMARFDSVRQPSYWSEMDAYHVLNVFSLYVAGHLLQDFSQSTDDLTLAVSKATVGEKNAEQFAKVLRLVEKARTGANESEMDWEGENYVLLSDSYPYEEIISECDELIPFVHDLIDEGIESSELPLPISLCDLLRLTIPHLEQIKQYAEFRRDYASLLSDMESGTVSKEEFLARISEIGEPIPEYNATIGLWGQPEARAQRLLVLEACEKYGVEAPTYASYDSLRKYRIYSELMSFQLGKDYPVLRDTYQYTCAYGEEETGKLMEEMVAEGILSKENNLYYLTDWENYKYNFND